jgi:cysteine desulfurase
MIYLDNNATTCVDPEVLEAMLPYLKGHFGNPSSMHRFGQEARQAVEKARRQVAELLGCDARELIFTSGGTEADNAAIAGMLAGAGRGNMRESTGSGARNLIVTSTVEHSAVREPLKALAKNGYEVVKIAVDAAGALDIAALEALLRERAREVALVTIMWANNETGIVFDVAAIGELCRTHGVVFHTDGVQAAGKVPVNLKELPVDLLSVSGHKFHGAKGTGALFVRRGVRWRPWIRGGPQERERRGGTENVPGIVGMGAAAELARQAISDEAIPQRIGALRDRLEAGILARVPESFVNGDPKRRVRNTTNIGFAGLEAEAILLLLSEADICASAGAACASGSLEPSHVLIAMGIPPRVAHGAIRFSLSKHTTEVQIDETIDAVAQVVKRLRETLPV